MTVDPDLSTTYLGLRLRTPLVASAGPLTGDAAMLEKLEAMGASAVVLPSLFEEQIEREALALDAWAEFDSDVHGEAHGYFPSVPLDDDAASRHLALVERARERLAIPVIASLNGTSSGGWVRYARHLVDAGAHAVELNLYDVVSDPEETAASVEQRYCDLVAAVCAEVAVPVAVKIGPWFTSVANVARSLVDAGARGLVLFNRFYQPDIDLNTLEVTPRLVLSTSDEARLALTWIGILHGQVDASLAATGGVHLPADVVKLLLAGADVVMTTSALLKYGPEHLRTLESNLRAWLAAREYTSVAQLKGSVSRRNVPDPHAYDRANYLQNLHSWTGGNPIRL